MLRRDQERVQSEVGEEGYELQNWKYHLWVELYEFMLLFARPLAKKLLNKSP